MVRQKKYVVRNRFEGVPKKNDFNIIETILPDLIDGEILIKAEWISVDPYLKIYNQFYETPYDQFGFQVGVVKESKASNYPVGTKVVTHAGWVDYHIVDTINETKTVFGKLYKLPELQGLSESHGVGAVGMPGATAYLAFLEICQPKAGETVVVSGAAGAVGSLVGQIAKIKGCKVIGFTGTDDKVSRLKNELGFDRAFNYKTVDVTQALKEAAPNGVDCYFDNVGGELSSQIIYQMNTFGRVSVVGSISSYNEAQIPKALILQPALVGKQLKIQGFLIWQWIDRWDEAFSELVRWICSRQIIAREHVTEGFDKIFEAFEGMLHGDNLGKAVVKVT